VDQSHRIVLTLTHRHADVDITQSDEEIREERSPSRRSGFQVTMADLAIQPHASGGSVRAVGLQVFLTLRVQRAPEHRWERADVRLNGGRHTIKGDWHGPSGFTVRAIVMVTAVSMLLGGISEVRKAPVGLLIATLFLVTVLAGLCAWVALGSRVHLQFSGARGSGLARAGTQAPVALG
jgi:hypothetical protein